MTDENFYREKYHLKATGVPAFQQYVGLMIGTSAIVKSVAEKVSFGEALFLGAAGLGIYLVGKNKEYQLHRNALANSFTHLEETLREEFKKSNQSRQ